MRARRRVGWMVAALALAAGEARAQAPAPRFDASPLLPEEHWAVRAAWRAEALGLAPGFLPAQRAVPRAAVAAALEDAVQRAGSGSPYAALAGRWRARFAEEFPEYAAGAPAGITRLSAGAAAGLGVHDGRLSPATGFVETRTDPRPLPDRAGVRVTGEGGVALGRSLVLNARAVADDAGAHLPRGELVAAAGPFALSAGRAEVGYGPGRGGGVVLSTAAPVGRVEALTTRPLAMGGVLRPLGSVALHTFAARTDAGRHPQRPWLWGARVAVQPHGRLTLGLSRAAIFGGDSVRATPGRIAGMLVGVLSEDFENQLVAVDARWRLPTDRVVPVTAYLEWGAEDGSGAWWSQPARVAGLHLPAVPGIPSASLGVEGARFEACCGHGAWYTHYVFRGNWARGDQPLGHPLGGEGGEVAVYGELDPSGGGVAIAWRLFARDRSAWTLARFGGGNLYSPARTGGSRGAEAEARVRIAPFAHLRAAAFGEAGGGWRERRVETEIEIRF